MSAKKIPLRMCTACREMKPKQELVRIVKEQDGNISFDPTSKKNGRGAYICKSEECLNKAEKCNALSRAFGINVDKEIYFRLREELKEIGK